MLRKLYIQNYAIIDEIEISFMNSLNIITGETGAGKSILMGALSLILGERADTSVLQRQDRKCIIEGSFAIDNRDEIKNFIQQLDAEPDEELLLRREIAANGKSRAFINDTPVNLQQLKMLASMLVDLHQQFDTLKLGNNIFQMQVVDALAGNALPLGSYKKIFHNYQQSKHELENLLKQKNNFNKEFDYNQYLYTELQEAALQPHELEDLETELKMLSHAEAIKTALAKIYFELRESENPVVQNIKQLSNQLHAFSSYHAALQSLAERLQSAQIEL
ncbi:MAG TPA: AAA family ATPase, partial [Chitinophagaceae bacterium]|nr:AAA family ATPase [Chitinophagaceae bacterium]